MTQKYQLGVIFCGMVAAFVVLLLPAAGRGRVRRTPLTWPAASTSSKAVDFSVDLSRRYTFWSGLLGGFFLALSYFGTDQSQVQRYLSGRLAPREPARPDVQRRAQDPHAVLHPAAGHDGLRLLPVRAAAGLLQPGGVGARHAQRRPAAAPLERSTPARSRRASASRRGWLEARHSGDAAPGSPRAGRLAAASRRSRAVRAEAKAALVAADPRAKTNGHRLRLHHVHPRRTCPTG